MSADTLLSALLDCLTQSQRDSLQDDQIERMEVLVDEALTDDWRNCLTLFGLR